tara:strand:- start:39 stop:338 length:300 start_codon:yes stop_codon:yes gene_type:complete
MPLLNSIILRLNEITTCVQNKNVLTEDDESFIRQIFKDISEKEEYYDVDEIESWFENEGSWNDKDVRMRVINISHYIQTKHENANKFRLVSEDSCNCDS